MICDQRQYYEDNQNSIYKDWEAGKNVYFKGEPADKLGHFLAQHVLKVTKKK